MTVRVLFYVQHLLGVGHLSRAALLSAAMVHEGLDVLVVLGGREVPGISFSGTRIVRLPAAHVADHTFSPLLDEDDRPVSETWKRRRASLLLQTFKTFCPDVVMCEMFPFGRRQFRFELLALLEAAHGARARVVSSVRDILVRKPKAGRDAETARFVRAHFDLVLVHGDPTLCPLDETFPEAKSIADLIRYTGYVRAPEKKTGVSQAGRDEVIVSVGGGAVGAPLLKAAMGARAQCNLAHKTWRFIGGPNLHEDTYRTLKEKAPDGVIVERFRRDFPDLLKNCTLSISQGGYNTIMDIVRAHATAIVVPFADAAQSEQAHRARRLAARDVITVVEASKLTPATLARAIDTARPPEACKIDFCGASRTAHIIGEVARHG